jgi:hypothetical protein
MTLVKIIQALHALNKVLSRKTIVFGVKQMHNADGEQYVWYKQVSLSKVVELSVDPD